MVFIYGKNKNVSVLIETLRWSAWPVLYNVIHSFVSPTHTHTHIYNFDMNSSFKPVKYNKCEYIKSTPENHSC